MQYTKPRITNVVKAKSAIQGVKIVAPTVDSMQLHTTAPAFPADE